MEDILNYYYYYYYNKLMCNTFHAMIKEHIKGFQIQNLP
jgi:hypothetical protein